MHLNHPYDSPAGGEWLRGNLHTHTTRSDGAHEPQAVVDRYAEAGYDFLMLSDHDVYTSAADCAALDNRGMVLIPGNEITANGPHIVHVGASGVVAPHADRQRVFDDINAGGGFPIVAHPNWYEDFDHCTHETLRAWTGYAGLEIFNGVVGRLHGSPYATDHWDRLLAAGRRVWGYAHDDLHDAAKGDFALGWNAVYASERSPAAVVEALRNGRFYASTGVEIVAIETEGSVIRLRTRNAERIVALREVARRFAIVDAPEIEVAVPGDARTVRFECWGRGETFAWTQPFWVEGNEA